MGDGARVGQILLGKEYHNHLRFCLVMSRLGTPEASVIWRLSGAKRISAIDCRPRRLTVKLP